MLTLRFRRPEASGLRAFRNMWYTWLQLNRKIRPLDIFKFPFRLETAKFKNGKKSERKRTLARFRLVLFPRRLAVPQTEGIEGVLFLSLRRRLGTNPGKDGFVG